MNRYRYLAIGSMLVVALTLFAQQGATAAANTDKDEPGQPAAHSTVSNVDQHLTFLSEKLDLTAGQQAKMRPILQQMFDDRQKIMQDATLSSEARAEKEKALHEKADQQARKFLSEDQKKKLDELEQQPHP
jgi:Spy/CpxP family protein refolding chaperone